MERISEGRETTAGNLLKTKEQLVEEAKKFNLLSNVFMNVALKDTLACQHVIRIITGIPDLIVMEVRTQHRISKETSHDAILDVLAEDGEGKLYAIEIQRQDTVDHARRTRFYAAMIDSEYLAKGKMYSEMPEVHIIYISETDLWKAQRTVYEVEKRFKDTDIVYEDGIYVMYVNAAVDDGSETARLMKYFKTADPEDMSQGELSKRVHILKCEEGGYQEMCEVSEKIFSEGMAVGMEKGIEKGMEKGIEKGLVEGELKKAKETAITLAEMGMPAENIAKAVKVGLELVSQWLSGASVARP